MLPIKQLPNSERPYEKLEMYGESTLSNAELLAIIIKTGTKEQTAVGLAQNILASNINDIRGLQQLTLKELQQIKGIGKVKAIQIKAVCELAKRMARPLNMQTVIKGPKDVADLFMEELRYEKREIVKLILLDTKNLVQKIVNIGIGNTNFVNINKTQIFEETIKIGMRKFILVHNHPSGDATPSKEDLKITKEIEQGAKILDLQMIDHIVIGDGKFHSILAIQMQDRKDEK